MKSSQVWKRWYLENLALNGSRLIYQGGDSSGPIRVVDLGPYRALYFDSPSCQGRIHRSRPWIPASDYITSMTFGAMLSKTHQMNRVLVLGLGPGAILHTLRKISPELQIHTLEVRDKVVEIAQNLFSVPVDENIDHIRLDAAKFLKQHKSTQAKPYDYVIVDLAISEGPSPLITQPAFWTELASVITPNGIICINLWRGKEHMFDWTIRQMTQTFNQDPLCVEHKHIENIIAFSSPAPLETSRIKEALKNLVMLPDELELNAREGLEFLLRQMMELTPESEQTTEDDLALLQSSERDREHSTQASTEEQEIQQNNRTEDQVRSLSNQSRIDPYEPSSPPGSIDP